MRFGLRELIFLVVLLAVPVASYIYVFQPRNADIEQARTEVQIKQARLEQLAQVQSQIDDIGLEIARGEEAIEVIEEKLPSAGEVEVIVEQVWRLAEEHDLDVKSMESQKPVPAALYMELPLRYTMEGNFDGFYEFLLQLENLPRITRIHNMELERISDSRRSGNDDAPRGHMRTEFSLSVYFESQ